MNEEILSQLIVEEILSQLIVCNENYRSSCNITFQYSDIQSLQTLNKTLANQEKYNQPMPWIGMYITFASLICILAIVADLVHGFRNRKLWFPCKYFTLNAASLTIIAVAMKLPVDLNNSMPSDQDQYAKFGSVSFMCTMMANLLPSLATMDSKELLTNIIALDILVITLFVNVCIQVKTGVIIYPWIQAIYVAMLLMLLIIYTSSALAILKSKHILESKYQVAHEVASKDQEHQQLGIDKLKQYVSKYWIMAGTGSPQFMTVCFPTTSASGVICTVNTFFASAMLMASYMVSQYESDYEWSIPIIITTQLIGAILGTIAPIFRCFATLNFKLSLKWMWKHINIFNVESYWTQVLCDWKQRNTPFTTGNRNIKILIENIKIIFISTCIGLQNTLVITWKIIALVPIFSVICVVSCVRCWKWTKAMFISEVIVLESLPEQLQSNQDNRLYVLQLEADTEVAERTLKRIIKSMNRSIKKAENQRPGKLIKFLEEYSSRDFAGVGKYDSHLVPPVHNCWSLSLVTLTTIAICLPNIHTNIFDMLMSSVSEGLAYVTLVEEILNATDKYVKLQKAAKLLWVEVELNHRWLGNNLKSVAPQVTTTTRQILEWFRDTSENIVIEVEGMGIEGSNNDLAFKSIYAQSMNRITRTILLSYQDNIEQLWQKDLSLMIADILAACLTNLPQVIAKKCHTNVIEKREASVFEAVQLLGKTTQIINTLQDRQFPSLNPDEFPFIDKWHAYLQHPIP